MENPPTYQLIEKEREIMFTVTDILNDVDRGCAVYNMAENKFSYRLVYFINERNGTSTKHYLDTAYDDLRETLGNIIRGNLTTTNTIVLAAVTTRKSGKTVSLLSRSYRYCLNEYFQKICEIKEKEYINNNYGRRKVQWC